MKNKQQRQGDVYFVPVKIPAGAAHRKDHDGILARGEATGHHHAVARVEEAEVYEIDNRTFLRVGPNGVSITHQEHSELLLPQGDYEVRIQTEEGPDEVLRNVAD